MPLPESPLDRPSPSSPSHPRSPGGLRPSSSGTPVTQQSLPSPPSRHGITGGPSSPGQTQDPMSDLPSHLPVGAEAPLEFEHEGSKRESTERGEAPETPMPEGADLQPNSGRHQRVSAASATGRSSSPAGGTDRGLPGEYKKGDVPRDVSPGEVERLRVAAMNAQLQLNKHREKFALQFGERAGRRGAPGAVGGEPRVSPIHEETTSPSLDAAFNSPISSGLDTASTESAKTVRGGMTPAASTARTPAYPFPPMRTPGYLPYSAHHPFTGLSPTTSPANVGGSLGAPHDQVLSGSTTPASTLNFHPGDSYEPQGESDFPTPNLYDLSLMLSAEPGLDAWWTTVVQFMRDLYKADRVTLSVPADSTDVENVPWGQKATFNAVEEDGLSLAYLPRGSSVVPSSVGTNETSNSGYTNPDESPPMPTSRFEATRPSLLSRHSFTTFESTKIEPTLVPESSRAAAPRPAPLARAQSYLSSRPDPLSRTAATQNTRLSSQSLQDHMDYEDSKTAAVWENPPASTREVRGRVFSVLQALDYEADPLIDSSGVLRVLERGKVIALTRDYPYLDDPGEKSGGGRSSHPSVKPREQLVDKIENGKGPDLGSRISSFLDGKLSRRSSRKSRSHTSDKGKSTPAPLRTFDEPPSPRAQRYEEYEQAPPSPWAQSPAPSPAIRAETGENPFFGNAVIDEETFNPNPSPQDYSNIQPLEAIGVDRSWTVLHIPLIHPLLSKPVQSFRLDTAAMESKSAGRVKSGGQLPKYSDPGKLARGPDTSRERGTPIAILSILSPVIPYPSNLRHSLEHLAPHLATSFSLCRHYSNLENQIAGLSRKRPQTAGFGAVAPGGRLTGDRMAYTPFDESEPRQSVAGSLTSPSDYSGVSRSAAGSPRGTPGWDPANVGLSMDKRSSGGSPSGSTAESYFSAKSRPGLGRVDTSSGSSITGARHPSKESSPAEARVQQRPRSSDEQLLDSSSTERREDLAKGSKLEPEETLSPTITPKQEPRTRPERASHLNTSENRDSSPPRHHPESLSPRRQAIRAASYHGPSKADRHHTHTQLHSYGADFGATFQSLPTTSGPSAKNQPHVRPHSRAPSVTVPTDMPPPSDRLKGLMLDSLPAHVFVALPQTGEIVWVNSRYLTYRGQTVSELYEDPWGSIHPDEREEYLKAWGHAVRTGEQFSMQVRIRRFDGTYRWFYTRAVGSRDIRGVIVQWYGSHMDIHDQHIAEVKAARQEEIEASEAKHRQLANLIPQIIFAATEDEGVAFANEQWLSYTGQDFNDALGLGFMDFVHPDDLARCHIPVDRGASPSQRYKKPQDPSRNPSQTSSEKKASRSSAISEAGTETTVKGANQSLSRNNSSSSSSIYDLPTADLTELAKAGVIKVAMDSNGRLSYTTEVRLRSKTGEYRWHLVRCVEVDNISLGSRDGSWFGACTDINDHKLLEAKLKEAMESKSKFLSNMSHEIRTPLIGISGMVNFLQDTVLNDEQLDYTNTIQSSASSLLNIINDILDLSKVDAGMMKLSYEWFHTRSLVEEVNEMVSTMAITKRLELNYVVDIDVPEMVKGDKFRIRQVLLNVIGNAIKFTTVGEVFSRCRVVKDAENVGENEIMLEYSIIDTGRGFTQEEADLIFKPFSQIDGSSTRQHGGSGLGLVISRQLVELHGGKMEGTAVPGKGSTFTFTAKFCLPTPEDHPEPPLTPALSKTPPTTLSASNDASARALRQAGGNPILANKLMHSPITTSPRTESSTDSPTVASSASSDPSLQSNHSHIQSPSSSVAPGLSHFDEAAQIVRSDLSQMKLALPEKNSPSPPSSSQGDPAITSQSVNGSQSQELATTPTFGPLSVHGDDLSGQSSVSSLDSRPSRPPMYSILLICPQTHSREATTQHIEITLPKDVPHQITPLSSVAEAEKLISGENPVIFTHIVLNLGSTEEIVKLIEQIITSSQSPQTSIVVLSDPVQRQEVMKMAAAYNFEELAKGNRVTFIYKPVKPSRFAVIFDPDKERDLSTDRNRSSAQQHVANQKQNYLDVGKRLGNKGLRVLLVEDNLVNQKVLLKFLGKVGIAVELAMDGVECTDKVFSHPHSFYSLILCDLHMPRKDGYQTCREIREWEERESAPRMPIIALSANVMADVLEKCVRAGFNSYVTKPVDFKALSTAMSNLLDPAGSERPPTLMKDET